ncbi:MAG: ATP-binding protein [Candidatus Omnitrophica bacterium]|nr:ATP-binding protein [Candidatus Omnitrophota bacterium]
MSKAIVLEGLPGCGKTSLINLLSSNKEISIVPEILDRGEIWANAKEAEDQDFFWLNDVNKMKIAKANDKPTIIDRGYASTLAYNYAKAKVDNTEDYNHILSKYYSDIVENNLKTDLYIYIEIPINITFKRKKREKELKNPWQDPKYLMEVINFYDIFFSQIEPSTTVLRYSYELAPQVLANKVGYEIKKRYV